MLAITFICNRISKRTKKTHHHNYRSLILRNITGLFLVLKIGTKRIPTTITVAFTATTPKRKEFKNNAISSNNFVAKNTYALLEIIIIHCHNHHLRQHLHSCSAFFPYDFGA